MPWNAQRPLAHRFSPTFARSRGDLFAEGWSGRAIASAVAGGFLIRARNGVYLLPHDDEGSRIAARVGGRLTCVSELARLGVFVLDKRLRHVHVAPTASRGQARMPREPVRRHWDRLARQPHPRSCSVEPFDALLHAVRCQEPRAAVATLDSAVRLGMIGEHELGELFRRLPRRYRILRRLIDARAESGPESLVRLMLRRLGCRFELQVRIAGVGRVDLLVAGWLIIECDSEAHHGGWEERKRDLRRDQEAAKLGYVTYRPIAEDVMWHPDDVFAALKGLLARNRRSELRSNRTAFAR